MTDESLRKAAQLMADAYRAGYDGKPMPQDCLHPTVEHQYLLGKYHAEKGKRSDFWTPYGTGKHGSSLSKVDEGRLSNG